MTLRPDLALAILDECTGDELWSLEHCRLRKVPESWLSDLSDAYESNFRNNTDTIYVPDPEMGERAVNQYHGIRDVDLAMRIGGEFGINVKAIAAQSLSRQAIVAEIKESILDG